MNHSDSKTSFDQSMDLFDDSDDQQSTMSPNDDVQSQSQNSSHVQLSDDGKVLEFHCPFCNEFELNESKLHLHIKSSHSENIIQNGELVTLPSILQNDANLATQNTMNGNSPCDTFTCPFCDVAHNSKEMLAEHFIAFHADDMSRKDLEELLGGLDFILCPLCQFICSTAEGMQQHVEVQHTSQNDDYAMMDEALYCSAVAPVDINISTCPMCGHQEMDPDLLKSHVEFHFETSYGEDSNPSLPSTSKRKDSKYLLSSGASSSSSSSTSVSKDNRHKNKAKGRNNYKQQYKENLEKAVMKGKMSPGDYHEHIAKMQEKDLSGVDTGLSKVEGLIEKLRSFYRNNSRHGQSAVLCHPTDYFCGSFGDKGWGCGYRNFQMLLSSLSQIPLYSHLFTDGRIPSVPKIQEMIETAWQKGFDREGCMQLEGKVSNTQKWIGATEIVATFSSLGVKCDLIDFPRPSSPDGTHPRLLQWVNDYFYDEENLRPPLYFQHQGHSRTIVGVEREKGVIRLLLFDPGSSIEHVSALKCGHLNWKQASAFRRTLAAFKAKQYQIVAVVGLLKKEDYEKSKKLTSTLVV